MGIDRIPTNKNSQERKSESSISNDIAAFATKLGDDPNAMKIKDAMDRALDAAAQAGKNRMDKEWIDIERMCEDMDLDDVVKEQLDTIRKDTEALCERSDI